MNKTDKYKSIKHDFFQGFDEQEIINNQKIDKSNDTPLAKKALATLFGFYEARYYLKVVTLDNEKILEVHLISDKPFSKDEINILKARLLVIYNEQFNEFQIFQEPESDIDSNVWLKRRKFFETNLNEDITNDPVYRVIGKITTFRTDREVHTYHVQGVQHKPKMSQKLNKSQRINVTFHKILKRMMQGKNFADFWVQSVSQNTDNDKKIELTIYITSKDERISNFFIDKEATTNMFKELFDGIKSVEVINMKDLED